MVRNKTIRTRVLIGAVPLVALLVAGCGGGGSSGVSHAQVLNRANADCNKAVEATAALGAPGNSYGDLNHYAQQLSPIVKTLIGNLDAIKPEKKADRDALEKYVASLRTGEAALSLLASAKDADQASEAVTQISSQPVAQLASELGAGACSATPQP